MAEREIMANGHKWPCPLFYSGNHGPEGPRAQCRCKAFGQQAVSVELTDQQQRWLDALAEGGQVRLVFTRKGPRWEVEKDG